MARILTPEQFRHCPRGTLFSVAASGLVIAERLLILDEIIPMRDGGAYGGAPYWGFWAIDPLLAWTPDVICAVSGEQTEVPLELEPNRYWSYEDKMDAFLVFDRPDVLALAKLLAGADWQTLVSPGTAA